MTEYIGNVAIPEIAPSGIFPIVSDYGFGRSHSPQVAIHRFGSANAKNEQRFYLGSGAKRFTVRKSAMRESDRIALRDFWEARNGPYGSFTYNAPNLDPENLVANGAFDSGTGWTLAGSAAISGGKLNINATGDWSGGWYTIPFIAGHQYTITYTITNYTSGSVRADISGLLFLTLRSSTGTFTETFTAPVDVADYFWIYALNAVLSVDNVILVDSGSTVARTVRFANEPLSWEMLSDQISSVGVTLIEIPSTSPTYTIISTAARFPSSGLQTALLSQVQEIIPLLKIQPRKTGYAAIYVSDRRCTLGAQLYQPRLLDFDGISQTIGNESDQAQFSFGNADRVMRDLVNDVSLDRASIEFSLYHVGTGVKLDLWKGEITDWSFDQGNVFNVSAADGIYELNLPYPTRKVSRQCWKYYNDANGCPFAAHSTGMDTAHFPDSDDETCDKSYDGMNGCLAHGMKHYFGGIVAEPQGVRIKDNSTGVMGFHRNSFTSTSIVQDSIYDQIIPEIYTDAESFVDGNGDVQDGMPVACKVAEGREESDFYEALGIIGEGPITLHTDLSKFTLDGQYNHGNPGSNGFRGYAGSDPAGDTDFFSLDSSGNSVNGDFRKVYSGNSTYKDNFAAGTAFAVIRRVDEAGIQLTSPGEHSFVANVLYGLYGWIWTASNSRTWANLTNPVWIAINNELKARGLRFASALVAEQYFDLAAAIAAAAICNTSVAPITGAAETETQFKFRGVMQEEKPLRDWIQETLMNCSGYFVNSFGKIKIGIRSNSSASEAFTIGNILFNSLRLSPLRPSFNHITAVFADREYNFAANSVSLYDADHAALMGGGAGPLYIKSNINLSGTCTKSQAARLIITRLREELGGITEEQWKAARNIAFQTTILALNVEPGMVCSMTHADMPDGYLNGTPTDNYGEFRVMGWKLNRDYSIDIEGRTTVDEMYDMTVGPKPQDVLPDAVPIEEPKNWNIPHDLQCSAIPNGLLATLGCFARQYNSDIDEAILRYKFFPDISGLVSGETTVDLSDVERDLDIVEVTGLAANMNGVNYVVSALTQGTFFFSFRLHNVSAGWSLWSDGNRIPIGVRDMAHTADPATADDAPADDWSLIVTVGPKPGTVILQATPNRTANLGVVLFAHWQIWDKSVGSRLDLDANTGPAVTYYDGSSRAHHFSADRTRVYRDDSGAFTGVLAGHMVLIDARSGSFAVNHTTEYIVKSVGTDYIEFNDRVSNPTVSSNVRIKVVRPPWDWSTGGYAGLTGYASQDLWGQNSDKTWGDSTTRIFFSPVIPVGSIAMQNVSGRVWFHTGYSCTDGGISATGPVRQYNLQNTSDSGHPSGSYGLTILDHASDASITEGSMAFQFYSDNINGESVIAHELVMGPSASVPFHGPYAAQKAAHASDVVASGTGLTIVAGSFDVPFAGGSPGAYNGKILLVHEAGSDLGMAGEYILSHVSGHLYLRNPINKSGVWSYEIVTPWYGLNIAAGYFNYDFWVPDDFTVWAPGGGLCRTKEVSMHAGTMKAQMCSRNVFGVSEAIDQ